MSVIQIRWVLLMCLLLVNGIATLWVQQPRQWSGRQQLVMLRAEVGRIGVA